MLVCLAVQANKRDMSKGILIPFGTIDGHLLVSLFLLVLASNSRVWFNPEESTKHVFEFDSFWTRSRRRSTSSCSCCFFSSVVERVNINISKSRKLGEQCCWRRWGEYNDSFVCQGMMKITKKIARKNIAFQAQKHALALLWPPLLRLLVSVYNHLLIPLSLTHSFLLSLSHSHTITNTYLLSNKARRGNRGSRGLGWYQKYREGRGGRHLQPKPPVDYALNDKIFDDVSESSSNKYYLEVGIDGKEKGRVVLELATKHLPITSLRVGAALEQGMPVDSKIDYIEKGVGCVINKLVPIEEGSTPSYFDDENHLITHDKGIVTLMNAGRDLNTGLSFMITTAPSPHLDGKYVAFGRVIEGMDVLQGCHDIFTMRGKPSKPVQILSSGKL
jgi:cyclophilin family peptidyl-prolyl cis-trans isomerase